MDLSDTGSHKKEYRQNGFLDIEVISYMPDFVGQRYLLKKNAPDHSQSERFSGIMNDAAS